MKRIVTFIFIIVSLFIVTSCDIDVKETEIKYNEYLPYYYLDNDDTIDVCVWEESGEYYTTIANNYTTLLKNQSEYPCPASIMKEIIQMYSNVELFIVSNPIDESELTLDIDERIENKDEYISFYDLLALSRPEYLTNTYVTLNLSDDYNAIINVPTQKYFEYNSHLLLQAKSFDGMEITIESNNDDELVVATTFNNGVITFDIVMDSNKDIILKEYIVDGNKPKIDLTLYDELIEQYNKQFFKNITGIDSYYGTINGYPYILMERSESTNLMRIETISEYSFYYYNDDSILVYVNGEFITLLHAYNDGIITCDELELLCNEIKEHFSYPNFNVMEFIQPIVVYKPVIYLYPTEEMDLTIKYVDSDRLLTTYPKYNDGWYVHVDTLGNITINDRNYYCLYFEEELNYTPTFEEGFYVEGSNAIEFLEEKLSILGFTEREANEFITYWLALLENNEHSLVYFEQTIERNLESPLEISNDFNMLRVIMHVMKVDGYQEIPEQLLYSFERVGNILVEWGGTIH